MAYATVPEVRARLPLITADVRTDDQIQDFIAQAAVAVDANLRGFYVLPLRDPLDPLVAFVALDLACGLTLENVYGEDVPNDVGHPATLKDRAQRLLASLRAGEIYLEHETVGSLGKPSWARPPLRRGDGAGVFGLGPAVLGPEDDD
jgi:hypothetical protein